MDLVSEEDNQKRFLDEQENIKKQVKKEKERTIKKGTSVFDGINQDEYTLKSHEVIRTNLEDSGVEDIDELEEDEWYMPSRY